MRDGKSEGVAPAARERERRRKERHRVDLPARFSLFVPSRPRVRSRSLEARTYDISEGGIRLLSAAVQADGLHVLNPATAPCEQCALSIEIETPAGVLAVCGQVVWYDRSSPHDIFPFQMGIRFIDVPPEIRERIRELCKR